MAGIGDYEEGKAFELKSGNKPEFKDLGGNSPGKLKNFGIGPGESPLDLPVANPEEYEKILAGYNKDTGEGKDGEKGKGWKKALTIGVSALTSGLDAVYGSGKILPAMSASLQKKKSDTKTKSIEERLAELENIDKKTT